MENSKEDLKRKVLNVLEQVRPYLQQDGGDISFIELINKDMIASEIIRALSGSIGLIIAIPISVLISANLFERKYVMRLKK